MLLRMRIISKNLSTCIGLDQDFKILGDSFSLYSSRSNIGPKEIKFDDLCGTI